MTDQEVTDRLQTLLRSFVKEHPLKKDTVLEEDVDDLIDFAKAFHVERELLAEVEANRNGRFWDFFRQIPEGVPPGQESILDELLADDED